MFNKKLQRTILSGMLAVAMGTTMVPVASMADVNAAVQETRLTLSQIIMEETSPQVQGTRVTLYAQCTGGTGEYTYTYKVMLPNGTIETIAENSSNEYINYTMNEVGVYNFQVQVSDGDEVVSDVKEFEVTPAQVVINQVKLNKTVLARKENVKFTISATPAEGVAKSKIVVVTPAGKKVVVKKFSSKMTASYKAKKKGNYKAIVTVKDGKTTATKTVSFKVK